MENAIYLEPMQTEKRIGGTNYIVTASFNGDKSRDMIKAIARLIERDSFTRFVESQRCDTESMVS